MQIRSIPVIDVGPYLAGVPGAEAAAARELGDALENVGFLSIIGHGVDWSLVESIYALNRAYHALHIDQKVDHPMSAGSMGYIPLGGAQRGDRPPALNAAFFMGRPGSKRNRFPSEKALPGFRETTARYYETLDRLSRRLLALYARAADMPAAYFDQFFDPALGTLRMTHYPPLPAGPDQWGIDPHSDAGFMTLLPTNPTAGLQVHPEGEEWFAVDQEPCSFVVNSGDTLRRWSNDRFRSTVHRALNTTDDDRYAIPFFFDPRVDTVIECLAGCTDADHPPHHEPLVYRDHLNGFMRDGYAQLALGTTAP